jgi:hypothetical protein
MLLRVLLIGMNPLSPGVRCSKKIHGLFQRPLTGTHASQGVYYDETGGTVAQRLVKAQGLAIVPCCHFPAVFGFGDAAKAIPRRRQLIPVLWRNF